jgi:hypothetical protein
LRTSSSRREEIEINGGAFATSAGGADSSMDEPRRAATSGGENRGDRC